MGVEGGQAPLASPCRGSRASVAPKGRLAEPRLTWHRWNPSPVVQARALLSLRSEYTYSLVTFGGEAIG